MATIESTTTPKKPWHPCDDCIDAIKLALDELAKSEVPGPDVYGYTSTCYSYRLGNAYSSADRELGRLWLASFLSPAIAGEFSQRLQSVLDDLRSWEERAQHLADPQDWPNPDDPSDIHEPTGLSRRLWDAFIEIQDQAAYTAQYLDKLSAIIRGKLRRKDELNGEQPSDHETEQRSPNVGQDRLIDCTEGAAIWNRSRSWWRDRVGKPGSGKPILDYGTDEPKGKMFKLSDAEAYATQNQISKRRQSIKTSPTSPI